MRVLGFWLLLLGLAAPGLCWAGQPAVSQPAAAKSSPARTAPGLPVNALLLKPRLAVRQTTPGDPAMLCEGAVITAEYVHHLPPRLLGAISLTETGRVEPATGRVRPWPWTINAQGEGRFFANRQQAIDAVQALQARGVQSIDVGCLQVNLMYHPNAFASLQAAFDPAGNADYAARFLNALNADGEDWSTAIASYHSETPALGDAYRALVMARWHNADQRTRVAGRSAYRDFVRDNKAYGDKSSDGEAYGAFAPASRVYGAFAPR